MAIQIRKETNPRAIGRTHRKSRIKRKLNMKKRRRPRLVVFRSNKFLYAQVIDDLKGAVLTQATTQEKDFESLKSKKNIEAASALGKMIGQRSKEKSIEKVVFDRNGYDYHGRVKALATGAREAGLIF